jgi:hypothetical protein
MVVRAGEARQLNCVGVDGGRVHGRHGGFRADYDRSGHAEGKDGWNDDGSSDSHDFLPATSQVSGYFSAMPDLGRTSASWEVLAFSRLFMPVCNR